MGAADAGLTSACGRGRIRGAAAARGGGGGGLGGAITPGPTKKAFVTDAGGGRASGVTRGNTIAASSSAAWRKKDADQSPDHACRAPVCASLTARVSMRRSGSRPGLVACPAGVVVFADVERQTICSWRISVRRAPDGESAARATRKPPVQSSFLLRALTAHASPKSTSHARPNDEMDVSERRDFVVFPARRASLPRREEWWRRGSGRQKTERSAQRLGGKNRPPDCAGSAASPRHQGEDVECHAVLEHPGRRDAGLRLDHSPRGGVACLCNMALRVC